MEIRIQKVGDRYMAVLLGAEDRVEYYGISGAEALGKCFRGNLLLVTSGIEIKIKVVDDDSQES